MAIKTVNASTLKKWMDQKSVIIVDVREPDEYNSEHIKGSKLVPLATVGKKTLPKVPKGKKLVFQCRLGKRSHQACEMVAKELPKLTMYNLEGGIDAWKAAGFDVIKGKETKNEVKQEIKKEINKDTKEMACDPKTMLKHCCDWKCSMSIDNQIRVIVGAMVVLGILLGYTLSEVFFFVTGVLGALFMFSGITGYCWLRGKLSCMSWNKEHKKD